MLVDLVDLVEYIGRQGAEVDEPRLGCGVQDVERLQRAQTQCLVFRYAWFHHRICGWFGVLCATTIYAHTLMH